MPSRLPAGRRRYSHDCRRDAGATVMTGGETPALQSKTCLMLKESKVAYDDLAGCLGPKALRPKTCDLRPAFF